MYGQCWWYMAGSSQPQHFFPEGCIIADFAIAVIFHPAIRSLWKYVKKYPRIGSNPQFTRFLDNF